MSAERSPKTLLNMGARSFLGIASSGDLVIRITLVRWCSAECKHGFAASRIRSLGIGFVFLGNREVGAGLHQHDQQSRRSRPPPASRRPATGSAPDKQSQQALSRQPDHENFREPCPMRSPAMQRPSNGVLEAPNAMLTTMKGPDGTIRTSALAIPARCGRQIPRRDSSSRRQTVAAGLAPKLRPIQKFTDAGTQGRDPGIGKTIHRTKRHHGGRHQHELRRTEKRHDDVDEDRQR